MNKGTVLSATAAALLVAGCGTKNDYANNPRPPSPITITAAISGNRVEVSPNRFGAGPITLVVTNQTQRLRDLVLESADHPGTGPGLAAQHTGPINPQGTASMKADLREGRYTVSVRAGKTIHPARLIVGHQRPSAQNQLLQP